MSRGKTDFLAPYRSEEDSADETILGGPPCDQRPTPQAVYTLETQDTQNQLSDLVDTFISKQQARIPLGRPFMLG